MCVCNQCVFCGVQGSSTLGESIIPLKSFLLTLLYNDDITWKPPGDAWRPQLRVLRVGGVRAVTVVAVGQLGGLLGVVLRGITTVIEVLLILSLLVPIFASLVVVSHCSRVVWLVVWLVVGLVAAVRQGLDWDGGEYLGSV